MERLPDLLMRPDAFKGLMMGNHALVRAMLEADVRVITTYPGSPTPEIAEAVNVLPKGRFPFYFEYSTNEKVASEVAFGAAINGHFSTVFFKSVGLNVASDSLVQFGLMDIRGGIVVVLGDDPGVNSSQNEQDNRHFARMSYIPMFEPATPEESYRMYLEAAEIAKTKRMAVFLRMTTHVCHAREEIFFNALPDTDNTDWTARFDPDDGGPFIPITKTVFPMKARALDKLQEVEVIAAKHRSNRVFSPNGSAEIDGKKLGVITASLPTQSVLENLDIGGQSVDVLKLGISYPISKKLVSKFLSDHDEVVVIEELDRIMEHEIKSLAFDLGISVRIFGKQDEFLAGELGPPETWDILSSVWPDVFSPNRGEDIVEDVTIRQPTFCPGCGHRAAFYAISKAIPDDAITVADIGCHTMGAFEPYRIGEVLLSMGHSNATGSGLAIGNDKRKVVTFIGDSTFFHAGLPGIINAVTNNHNITLIVMENGTTAMTGQQPHPGSGEMAVKVSIDDTLAALGVAHVKRVSAYAHDKLIAAVKEAVEVEGFSVVIANHPCMLKFTRKVRRQRRGKGMPQVMTVNHDVAKGHYDDIVCFDCPSFQREEDGSLGVNEDLCVGDGSCRPSAPKGGLVLVKREEVE